jgi:hypothetical protein
VSIGAYFKPSGLGVSYVVYILGLSDTTALESSSGIFVSM